MINNDSCRKITTVYNNIESHYDSSDGRLIISFAPPSSLNITYCKQLIFSKTYIAVDWSDGTRARYNN